MLSPARVIPRGLTPTNVKYRAMLAATQKIDRVLLAGGLISLGLQIVEDVDGVLVAEVEGWQLRLRSVDSATTAGAWRGLEYFRQWYPLPAHFELASSEEDYVETWEVTGEFEVPDGARRDLWMERDAGATPPNGVDRVEAGRIVR